MRFLVDVDGVVGDLMTTMVADINEKFRRHESPPNWFRYDDITDFYFINPELGILSPGECKFAVRVFSRPGLAYDIPPIPGAKQGIKKILDAGHEVVFVTSDWQESTTWVNDRRKWIEEHFGDFEVIFCHKKHLVIGDVLIDDRYKTCKTFADERPQTKVLMYNQPWNKKFDVSDLETVTRFTWADIDAVLEELS